MKRHSSILTILIITAFLLLGNTSVCAAFDLFNPERGKPPPPPKTPVKTTTATSLATPFKARPLKKTSPRRPARPKKPPPQKDFTLSGTSRIGDRRAVVLKGPDNKEFIQYFENNQRTPIKGFPDYYLISVEAREVKIEYPQEFPCSEDRPKKALKCEQPNNNKTFAVLKLKQREALPPAKKPKPPQLSAADKAKKREESKKKRKELYKNFKRKVIKDEDVPPGMRVVRTPFGDRLVPLK